MRGLSAYACVLLVGIWGAAPYASAANLGISTKAYSYLTSVVTRQQTTFSVFESPDSAYNHGDPGGFFCGGPNTTENLSLMSIDTACHYDASAPKGCSTDPTRTDQLLLRITLPPLSAGNFCGIIFTEPAHFESGAGYNLVGSSKISFQAMSPQGLSVAFGAGGATGSYIGVPSALTPMSIDLTAIAPAPNLSQTNLLWTVVSNDLHAPSGGTLYVQNIMYTPVPTSQTTALGLPPGYSTFPILPVTAARTGLVPIPPDQLYRNAAPTADVSMAAIAFLRRKSSSDLKAAALILDTFDYALAHPNQGLPLPAGPGGSHGLYNCYSAGDIALLNVQPGGSKAGDARLCGFSHGSSFDVVFNGASATSNAWAILAFLHGFTALNKSNYLADARNIGNWIYGTMLDPSTTGYGGYFQGFVDGAQTPLKVKWTSGNALIYAAFNFLAAAEESAGNSTAAAEWQRRAGIAGSFAQSMLGPNGQFFQGTVPVGQQQDLTIGVMPNGTTKGGDAINAYDALESNTLAALAMSGAPSYRGLNWAGAMRHVLAQSKRITAGAQTYLGFDVVQQPVAPVGVAFGADGIGWQYTAQVIAALKFVQSLYPGSATDDFVSQANSYLSQIQQAQQNAPNSDGNGLVAAILNQNVQPYDQCINTPFGCLPARLSLSATAFAIFAEQGFNPMVIPATLAAGGTTNGGSFIAAPNNAVAANTIISIFGANEAFAPAGVASLVNGALPFVIQGTGVQINGVCAPLFFVSPGQINAQAISTVGNSGTATVVVNTGAVENDCTTGTPSNSVSVPLAAFSPALFTLQFGQGLVAGINALTGQTISAAAPVPVGAIATIYGTGFGATTPPSTAGVPAVGTVLLASPITVAIGGVQLAASNVKFAGMSAGSVGLYQFNLEIPQGVPAGLQPITITVGGVSTQSGAVIAIAP
jgi:uncharacterized protein (TIGR03437 family)